MAFTAEQIAYLRTRLGTVVDEDTNPTLVENLEERYDRLGTVQLVAVEVLRERLADIANALANPLSFSISGEYSQDSAANVPFLKSMLALAEQEAGVPGSSLAVAVPPGPGRWRR